MAERESHNLTHLPYTRWCRFCVKAKGKESHHFATANRLPVIQVDSGFLGTKEDKNKLVTLFTAIDVRTQMSMACVVPSKSVNRYALTEFERFVFETGRTQAVIQCDDESSIKALARACSREVGGFTVRVAPTSSSKSQGSIERHHQTLFAQIRTLRLALTERLQVEDSTLKVDTSIFPWMVKHAAWLLNRFLVHDDGLTAFQRRYDKGAPPGLAEFGEMTLFRVSGRHHTAKADATFKPGVWLGRDPDSGEHLLGTANGVFKSRSIRRMAPSEKFNKDKVCRCRGI